MELDSSLGHNTSNPPFSFLGTSNDGKKNLINNNKDFGFYNTGLSLNTTTKDNTESTPLGNPSLQLVLFPPLSVQHKSSPQPPINQQATTKAKDEELESDEVVSLSSPRSIVSHFQMELSNINRSSRSDNKREYNKTTTTISGDHEDEEEENGSARKKLRLSKDQSAFLEDSFKDHHTLNPKQKLALAKQLNLCPRQVEVWFQNRRARTKLKQTEVDCDHLKRCCDTLTEENKKLKKELQELRALKSSQPYFMQLPPTTLTMCPSCERVSSSPTSTTTSTTAIAAMTATTANSNSLVSKSVLHPFIKHARHTAS